MQYVSHMPDICKCCGIVHQKHAGTDVTIMKQYATTAVQKLWELSIYTVVFKAMTSCGHGYPQLFSPSSGQKALLFKYIHLLTLQRGVTGTARMLHALTHSSISQVREQM